MIADLLKHVRRFDLLLQNLDRALVVVMALVNCYGLLLGVVHNCQHFLNGTESTNS